MRVGVDYLFARTHAPGVGRYAREMTRAMVSLPDSPQLKLLEFGRDRVVMSEASLGLDKASNRLIRRRIAAPRRLLNFAGRVGIGADRLLGGVDLFQHVRLPVAPVSRATEVLTVSDLPSSGTPAVELVASQLRRIDHFLVFSRHYAARLMNEFGIEPDQIHLVPVGADHWRRDMKDAATPPPRPRILVLGAPRAERRHEAVLDAVAQLVEGGVDATLHVAGRRSVHEASFEETVARSGISDRVTWALPTESDLPKLVAESSIVVHLTDDEGTAVTPLEALTVGTAVVASRVPAFEEVLSDGVRYIDTREVVERPKLLADALATTLRSDLSEAARRRRCEIAAPYTWENNARATLEKWRSL